MLLIECNSGIRHYCIYYEFSGFSISIYRHCMWSRDALVRGVSGTIQIHGRRPKKTPWKNTERLSRFVWRRSAGSPRTSAEKFICVQMARSPRSDIQMMWFQFEELDIEVTYNTSEDERNRSYESKVMAILRKCVGAVASPRAFPRIWAVWAYFWAEIHLSLLFYFYISAHYGI